MEIRVRCGEVYNFNLIKSITDCGNGVIEIFGNFKPRGRHKHVKLFKMSIENWDEITNIFEVELKPYFCLKCKQIHKSGKVFEEHIKFMGEKKDLIPTDRIIKADASKLREIGKRQLLRLLERMKLNPRKSDVYRREINKLFIYEGVALEKIL